MRGCSKRNFLDRVRRVVLFLRHPLCVIYLLIGPM
jgi:hypothetical protein